MSDHGWREARRKLVKETREKRFPKDSSDTIPPMGVFSSVALGAAVVATFGPVLLLAAPFWWLNRKKDIRRSMPHYGYGDE